MVNRFPPYPWKSRPRMDTLEEPLGSNLPPAWFLKKQRFIILICRCWRVEKIFLFLFQEHFFLNTSAGSENRLKQLFLTILHVILSTSQIELKRRNCAILRKRGRRKIEFYLHQHCYKAFFRQGINPCPSINPLLQSSKDREHLTGGSAFFP